MDPTAEATALEILVFPVIWGMLGYCGLGASALIFLRAMERLARRVGGGDSTAHDPRRVGF
jgi:hypothetical protein